MTIKYTPTDFDNSVNVSSRSPLKEFLQYLLSICIIFVVFYFILGLLVDFCVNRISLQQENWLWEKMPVAKLLTQKVNDPKYFEARDYIQSIIDRVPHDMFIRPLNPRIEISNDEQINAFAIPGNSIVITAGLLRKIKTENGLMFILGHEIGHFMNRDPLRSLGRGLVVMTAFLFAFGSDTPTSNFVTKLFSPIQNKFSQSQETRSDEWGVKVLQKVYGHAAGATEFFEIVLKERSENRLLDAFSTHPLSQDRINHINQLKNDIKIGDGTITQIPVFLSNLP